MGVNFSLSLACQIEKASRTRRSRRGRVPLRDGAPIQCAVMNQGTERAVAYFVMDAVAGAPPDSGAA